MKNFKVVLQGMLLLVVMLFPAITFAQEEVIIDNSENLDIVLSYDNQSPKTKGFYLIADVASGIDSDRVVVEWILPSEIEFVDELESPYSRPTVSTGQTTQVQKNIVARYSGTYEIEAIVTAVKADVNYVSSDKIELTFNEKKEIIPMSDEYKQAKTLYQLAEAVLYFGIAMLGIGLIYFLYKQIMAIRS